MVAVGRFLLPYLFVLDTARNYEVFGPGTKERVPRVSSPVGRPFFSVLVSQCVCLEHSGIQNVGPSLQLVLSSSESVVSGNFGDSLPNAGKGM